ncbi:cyclin-dependent kinase inhibitor 2c-related [Anaeramoeba flamelloides]|uniref:Cyclin-dependent kinase inhibitor 2c-related n=1 Tax=Anaeramoeba flamelloides TaxID=1746091 RepID=A0AAV7YQB9_9EUKA|nr:cyclin-dependent kinase inhibitor 2c-related [Anaeramoeba flamelloides]
MFNRFRKTGPLSLKKIGLLKTGSLEQIKNEIKKNHTHLTTNKGWTALHIVCRYNAKTQIIIYLLKLGCSPNSQAMQDDEDEWSPLHILCKYHPTPEGIETLITLGSNPNLQTKKFLLAPLHILAERIKEIECFVALLSNGALVNTKNKEGQTPLQIICVRRGCKDTELIKLLLQYNADPNIRDNSLRSPLHVLCRKKVTKQIVQQFLKKDAYPNAQDRFGWTPMHLLALNKDVEKGILSDLFENGGSFDLKGV